MTKNDSLPNWQTPMITPRKRTLNETRDLAIHVIGRLYKPLAFYFSILAVPVFALDFLLWALLFSPREMLFGDFWGTERFFELATRFTVVWLTISLETHFVGSLVTQYLGMWLFSGNEPIPPKRVLKSWGRRWFQILYFCVATRILRRPSFYPEVILLEQTPFFRTAERFSTRKRVRYVRSSGLGVGSLFSVLTNETFIVCGVLSAYVFVYMAVNTVFPTEALSSYLSTFVCAPLLIFACKLFNVVFNFCSYINYRVSAEGWDVDLAFKTELIRFGADDDEQSFSGAGRRRARSRTLAPISSALLKSTELSLRTSAVDESGHEKPSQEELAEVAS